MGVPPSWRPRADAHTDTPRALVAVPRAPIRGVTGAATGGPPRATGGDNATPQRQVGFGWRRTWFGGESSSSQADGAPGASPASSLDVTPSTPTTGGTDSTDDVTGPCQTGRRAGDRPARLVSQRRFGRQARLFRGRRRRPVVERGRHPLRCTRRPCNDRTTGEIVRARSILRRGRSRSGYAPWSECAPTLLNGISGAALGHASGDAEVPEGTASGGRARLRVPDSNCEHHDCRSTTGDGTVPGARRGRRAGGARRVAAHVVFCLVESRDGCPGVDRGRLPAALARRFPCRPRRRR